MARLAGKRAVIIGAAGADNMGQAIARRFAREGARVVVAGRRLEPLQAFAAEIGGMAASCDITDKTAVFALADAAKAQMGGVDIAVNASGWGLLKPLLDVTEEELNRIVALQFTGVHHFAQAFVAAMLENKPSGGSIVQISSATTGSPISNHAAYIGTKAGSEALMRCVANDFGSAGIRANSVSPAFTLSPMTKDSFAMPGMVDAFLPRYPLGRLNTAEDVANACLWLASDEAFVTGENIRPNGGLALRGNPQQGDIGAAVAAAMALGDSAGPA